MVSGFIVALFCSYSLAQVPQKPSASPEALATAAPKDSSAEISQIQRYLEPFEYNSDDLRDPFEMMTNGSPLKPGQVYGPFLPLQNWSLSEFRLKGLMWKTRNPVAVFVAPDGKEHKLKVKDYIGENFGYIATIREKEVVVIQTIEEDNKRYSTTRVVFLE